MPLGGSQSFLRASLTGAILLLSLQNSFAEYLSGDELRRLISKQTLQAKTAKDGELWQVRIRTDGTADFRLTDGSRRQARWTIEGKHIEFVFEAGNERTCRMIFIDADKRQNWRDCTTGITSSFIVAPIFFIANKATTPKAIVAPPQTTTTPLEERFVPPPEQVSTPQVSANQYPDETSASAAAAPEDISGTSAEVFQRQETVSNPPEKVVLPAAEVDAVDQRLTKEAQSLKLAGYSSAKPAQRNRIAVGSAARFSLDLKAGHIYAVLASCDQNCTHVALTLRDPRGSILSQSPEHHHTIILTGPATITGNYEAEIKAPGCKDTACGVGLHVLELEKKD